MSNSLQPHGLYSPWNSPSQNTGVGSRSLLQWIFPTQGSNPGLPHCRWILYQLSHKESPRTLEWVAYPFSRVSSWPRNRTRVSCITGRFFTHYAITQGSPSEKLFNREKLNHIRSRKDKSWTWCKLSKSLSVIAGHERHIIWNII